jgi:hypothetical protein
MPRKTKYKSDFPEKVEELAKKGLMDYQIWEQIGISCDTFYTYINKYPEFSEAIKRGRLVPIQNVESALYKRAIGYETTEEISEVKVTESGETKPSSYRKVKKHIAPDVGAAAFYLKNKAPEKWKDRHNYEHKFDENIGKIEIEIVSNEQES